MTPCILALNAGSSSLKLAVFAVDDLSRAVLRGKVDRIGTTAARLTLTNGSGRAELPTTVPRSGLAACAAWIVKLLEGRPELGPIQAVGHRIVHGGKRREAALLVTPRLLVELEKLRAFAPVHLPAELEILRSLQRALPRTPQVACLDTAFHADLPLVARLLPIPRRFAGDGVLRYGFHGLSYTYLLGELHKVVGPKAARGRVILAHLGNGASMAAVHRGKCVDTTMAFTPAAGLVMGTRSGDIDPGLVAYLARTEGMKAAEFDDMVNHQSGLLGLSETSADVRDLLARRKLDSRAEEALDVFCRQAKKSIGALATVLGGLDLLVFSGGIGENSPEIRAEICSGLEHLGIQLDSARNRKSALRIGRRGRKGVLVIQTDEERLIAELSASVVEQIQRRSSS